MNRVNQHGVALAIVLWFVAGMTLLVAAIVAHARIDTQMAQLHLARAKAVASGDGAISLMLAEQAQGIRHEQAGPGRPRGYYQLGDTEVIVLLYPASGLLNFNTADEQLLSLAFSELAGVAPQEANVLAGNVIKSRNGAAGTSSTRTGSNQLQAFEDLLGIEGVQRTMLDALRDFAVAGQMGAGRIDWALAPDKLLGLLARSDPAQLTQVERQRENLSQSAMPPTRNEALQGTLRADALVTYGGVTWLRRQWIVRGEGPASRLPWRVLRTEPPRVHQR